jgi:hypothetical protein
MIFIFSLAGYLLGSYLTVCWGRNICLNSFFEKELVRSKRNSYFAYEEVRATEMALHEANRRVGNEMPLIVVIGGTFWPLYLLGLIVFSLLKFVPELKFFKSKSEKYVENLKKNEQEVEARKLEWKNALKTLKDAGIDTTELRKIKIE